MFTVSYDFYKNEYKGKVQEAYFEPLMLNAVSLVDYYTFNRINDKNVLKQAKFAVCELIDAIDKDNAERLIASEKSGNDAVTYDNSKVISITDKAKMIVRKHLLHTGLMYRGF